MISTHAPLAGRDFLRVFVVQIHAISTHAPLAGRDHKRNKRWNNYAKFQPTRPLRGATSRLFQQHLPLYISTHAPLAGRDMFVPLFWSPSTANFNPRAPCGARLNIYVSAQVCVPFQPTRPLRGATAPARIPPFRQADFNPRAPCGARPVAVRLGRPLIGISTHAPLAGRDS